MEPVILIGAGVLLLALGVVVLARGGKPREDGVDPFATEQGAFDEPEVAEPQPELTLVRTVAELREKFGRPAFLPVCAPGQPVDARSHFCGRPWLMPDESWPACGSCSQPLRLFLQLDLDALPDGAPAQRSGGLLQLFYCTSQNPQCEVVAEQQALLARVVDPELGGDVATRDESPGTPYPAQHITDWSEVADAPAGEEWKALGIHVPGDDEVLEDQLYHDGAPVEKDKLGGWPKWPQATWYPACADCGRETEYVFQIVSEDHVPYMFGDAGVGRVTRCPEHSRNVYFTWDCH